MMDGFTPDLKTLMAARIRAAPDAVWTAVDFLDIGSRNAVDKMLQRLTHASYLRRLDRGLYDQPQHNQLTGQLSVPDYRRVIEAVARRDQTRMLVDGMTAANDLGLSDAVPGQIVVHTDARLRPIKLGKQTIVFRPTAPSKLFWAGRPAMRMVQALHWLHAALADPGDRRRILRQMRVILADPDQGSVITADLIDGLPTLPTWMQSFVRELVADGAADYQDAADDDRHRAVRRTPRRGQWPRSAST